MKNFYWHSLKLQMDEQPTNIFNVFSFFRLPFPAQNLYFAFRGWQPLRGDASKVIKLISVYHSRPFDVFTMRKDKRAQALSSLSLCG